MAGSTKLLQIKTAENELKVSDGVYGELLNRIVSGQLRPGDTINELSLARELDVSRTPVHDAVSRLVGDGLVTQEGNRRRTVKKLAPADVLDIFDMRTLLEGEAAYRAANRIDRPSLDVLNEMAGQMDVIDDERAWMMAWAEFDDQLHSQIAAASGSLRLFQDIQRYRTLHRVLNRLHTSRDILQNALLEHRAILAALGARDAEAARTEMESHIHEWQIYFSRVVQD